MKCRWVYRPGKHNSMWATASCDHISRPLTKLFSVGNPNSNKRDNEVVGCANWYNDKLCPGCGNPIEIDYILIKEEKNTDQC